MWAVVRAVAGGEGKTLGDCNAFFGDIELIEAARRLSVPLAPPEEVYGPFGSLAPALDLASKLPARDDVRVWSRESSKGAGSRTYFVASVEEFWKQIASQKDTPCAYEVIQESRATRLFLDLEYAYDDDDDYALRDGFERVSCLLQLLTHFVDLNFPSRSGGISYEWLALESLYDTKFSMHVIFSHVVFSNVHTLGRFMAAFLDFLRLELTRKDDHFASLARQCFVGAENRFIVDMGVYSKHRNFRTVYSSKLGKDSPLIPLGGGASRDLDVFLASLVVPPHPQNIPFLEYHHTSSPQRGFRPHIQSSKPSAQSSRPIVDDFVRSIIAPQGGYVRTCLDLGNDRFLYSIAGGYRFCANIGRMHKSNNVMFIADMRTRKLYQRCYDPDCKQFESQGLDIPGAFIEQLIHSGALLPDDILMAALLGQLE